MRALDTNILVFGAITRTAQHEQASDVLRECAEGASAWALPWPCVYEFLRVVTHARVYHPPMPRDAALDVLRALFASPSLTLLSETPRHADVMEQVVRSSGASGNLMHDVHIAALCIEHGVTELITGDRDFSRFTGLKVTDPFAS